MAIAYRLYQRPFRWPLQTAHGVWDLRQGILLRGSLSDGSDRFGEIAPLPWFGSETLADAQRFCREDLQAVCQSWPHIDAIPDSLPACQFGVSTLAFPLPTSPDPSPAQICGLLPTGRAALAHWSSLWHQGHRTLKWKIGVTDRATEIADLLELLAVLPATAQLRLDANGGLALADVQHWLDLCDRLNAQPQGPTIEFLEQPLAPIQFEELLTLSHQFQTPMALDESVATYHDLIFAYRQGWRGLCVVKPAIAGDPAILLKFCREHPIDLVFSSVFETPIGLRSILALAHQIYALTAAAYSQRSLGLGTTAWFNDNWQRLTPERLWEQL
jgi:O-succinylbenzoate synthase